MREADRQFKVAGTRIDILERLLDTYVEIGDVIPGFQQYDQLFRNCPAVREILERYLYDILQFHRKALDVFARPAWETALRSAWKTFETSFKSILDSLKRHRTLLSDEKLTAAIAEIQDVRQLAVTRFNEQSAHSNTRFDELSKELHNRFQELSKQLYENQEKSAEMEAREQQEALRQQRDFIAKKLGAPDYEADQDWASEQRFSASGDWILKDPGFLSWLNPRNPSHSTLFLHGMPGAELRTLSVLKELAQESLKSQHRCLIVLDGLDECVDGQNTSHEGLKGIIEWFQNSVIPNSRSEGGCIQLLLAGQRDGVLDQHLSASPGIKLDTIDAHLRDIWDYAVSRASEVRERFSLSHDMQAQIISKVTAASKGMFLYVKVVLDNLMGQGSEAELENELKTENFPDGLNSAPLRWREIQSRFCINFEQGCCNFKNRRVDSCKVLCGSLVEAEQSNRGAGSGTEIIISLVHDTAAKYLIHTGRICLFEEHTEMALFCCRYLTSGPFKLGVQERSIRDFALSGYYGFHDYAGAFWHHHVDSVLNLAADLPLQLSEEIARSVFCLLGDYEVPQQTGSTTSSSQPAPTAEQVRKILQEWRDNGQKGSFEDRTSAVRRVIELIDVAELDDGSKAVFLGLNGVPRFKCPKPWCQRFALGFMDRHTRDAHVEEHERSFKCPNEGCYARSIGFPTRSALDAHVKRLHSDNANSQLLFPPSKMRKTDIFTACARGDLDAVKAFVRQGIDLDMASRPEGQLTPLVLAARNGHVLVCQYLIQNGAQIYLSSSTKSRGTTALGEAIKRRDFDLFRILVETAGEQERLTVLGRSSYPCLQNYVQAAVESGAVEILKDLLSWYKQNSGATEDTSLHAICGWVDAENNDGNTLLHIAAANGDAAILKLLLTNGEVDPNLKNKSGETPLHRAAQGGHQASGKETRE
ncbi:hypothetical protein DL770_008288 [Monosporascus sp. CRB-9-2]|nr:hypothetical protein DL770_008288 [Monosporascus sp. CRB-9-2]